MIRGPIQSLFDRLFGSTDDVQAKGIYVRHVSHLADAVNQLRDSSRMELADSPERSVAVMAAHLDGVLDEVALLDLDARLAKSPMALQEIASAEAFIHAVETNMEAAPADLVASTIARSRTSVAPPARQRHRFPIWSLAAFAMALAAVVVLMVAYRHTLPTDSSPPMAVKSAPEPTAIAKPQAPQGDTAPPTVAGKEEVKPKMLPAGNEATVPSSRPQKDYVAPEGMGVVPEVMDVVPGKEGKR